MSDGELFRIEQYTARAGAPTHLARAGRGMNVTLYCTGRSLAYVVRVEGIAVTCKACIKRAAKNGISLDTEGQ